MTKKKTIQLKPLPIEARILEYEKIALNTRLSSRVRGYALHSLSKMGKKAHEPLVDFIKKTEPDDEMREFACRLVDRMRQRSSANR